MTHVGTRLLRSLSAVAGFGPVLTLATGAAATFALMRYGAGAAIAVTVGAALLRGVVAGVFGLRDAAPVTASAQAPRKAGAQSLLPGSPSQARAIFAADGTLVACDDRLGAMLGLPADRSYLGLTLLELIRRTDDAGSGRLGDVEAFVTERQALLTGGTVLRGMLPRWSDRPVFAEGRPILGGGWALTLYDFSGGQTAPPDLRFFDRRDRSTNLPDRDHVLGRLQDALDRRAANGRDDHWPALLQIDIARMKSFHSSMDMATVDRLLNEIKDRLLRCLDGADLLGRVRVDEFAVLPARCTTAAQAVSLAERLLAQVNGRYEVGGRSISIVASIGIALAPQHGTGATQLLQRATIAMQAAVTVGGTWRMFAAAMEGAIATRLSLESDMARALEQGQFQLVYQPQINLRYNCIAGFEALLRWHHPQRGVVSPLDFIPLAETSGLIVPLGTWVIRNACHDAVAWPCGIRVAVNLSVIQLHDAAIVAAVQEALASSGLPPQRLELEVTETVLLEGDDVAMTVLHALRALGVRISMDDFGTGHSSLSYLRDFPFDKIKIDKSFIQQMLDRPDCLAIVRTVTGLAGSLGMAVTAEGAETAAQVERLRLEGCTEVQGFYFSRPRPLGELNGLLERDFSLA